MVAKKPLNITPEDIAKDQGIITFPAVMDANGITKDFLAKLLKKELKAKKTVLQKLKRDISADRVDDEIRALEGGKKKKSARTIEQTSQERVIAVDMIDWDTRQKARMDAQKLFGLYPAEKSEVDQNVSITVVDRFPDDKHTDPV